MSASLQRPRPVPRRTAAPYAPTRSGAEIRGRRSSALRHRLLLLIWIAAPLSAVAALLALVVLPGASTGAVLSACAAATALAGAGIFGLWARSAMAGGLPRGTAIAQAAAGLAAAMLLAWVPILLALVAVGS